MQFVEVVWLDAWVDDDNFATVHGLSLTHKPLVVKTRGWLLVDDTVGVSVANEESTTEDDGKVYRGRTFIPRAMIQSVTPYKLAGIRPKKPRKPRPKPEAAPVETLPTSSNT